MADDDIPPPPESPAKPTPSSDLRQAERDASSTPFASGAKDQSHAELLELARDFLKDESIQTESRERKVGYLQSKGLNEEDIENLLSEQSQSQPPSSIDKQDLKTVHDSTDGPEHKPEPAERMAQKTIIAPTLQLPQQPQQQQRDMPPVITYPEFLLRPQKPPPLVTFQRLAYAAYALAGVSALTYGANKYLVQPMLETLTESRHDLASTAVEGLEKLNIKLESTVSHVPYSASIAAIRAHHDRKHDLDHDHTQDGGESIASDPTELFHRDMATQTRSRSPSTTRSATASRTNPPLNSTTSQSTRLSSLVTTLQSLHSTLNPDPAMSPYLPTPASKTLGDAVTDFQLVLDKLETTYNPFRSDYSNLYSTLSAGPGGSKGSKFKDKDNNEAAKFRAEIRSLKGAFLSSRNFPSAVGGGRGSGPYGLR